MQSPVRHQASVTLPGSKPSECPDSYLIERKNQKKVVLNRGVWKAGCKLLRINPCFSDFAPTGLNGLSRKVVPIHRMPRVTDDKPLFRATFPHKPQVV